eukprot:GHVS01006015.1.p1 GENE.GHVS01006015.1~~GHVS01006015.1.p1  ORF type:complete len:784 (-),score=134.79 GHVS01006015.1:45-2396(-)
MDNTDTSERLLNNPRTTSTAETREGRGGSTNDRRGSGGGSRRGSVTGSSGKNNRLSSLLDSACGDQGGTVGVNEEEEEMRRRRTEEAFRKVTRQKHNNHPTAAPTINTSVPSTSLTISPTDIMTTATDTTATICNNNNPTASHTNMSVGTSNGAGSSSNSAGSSSSNRAGSSSNSAGSNGDDGDDVVSVYVQNICEGSLSEDQILVLRALPNTVLIKVVQRLAGGESITAVLAAEGQAVMQSFMKAAADQYGTMDAPTGDAMIEDEDDEEERVGRLRLRSLGELSTDYFMDIAKVVPLRLRYEERPFLRLLEAVLEVSEYTDKIDVLHRGNKARAIAREIRQVCSILSGLVVAHDYEAGQRLIRDREFADNAGFFRTVFEIGRRYKILNPERMRSNYGKLMYLLMDLTKPEIEELLGFSAVIPVNTVYRLLSSRHNGLELLKDPLVATATMEIMPAGKTRYMIDNEIRAKGDAVKFLARRYCTKPSHGKAGVISSAFRMLFSRNTEEDEEADGDEDGLSSDEIEKCLHSLADHNAYLRFNRDPCDSMINHLTSYFPSTQPESGFSLSIDAGRGGSRLSHSHSRQYLYVLQSLTLWREVAHEMFAMWHLAERDMLSPTNIYHLADTGQGLNRVQRANQVSTAMQTILSRVQHKVGGWVGSAVVHLGDRDVPNALMFIDKYTQVPRILGPIVLCLEKLPHLYQSKKELAAYIDSAFGGVEKAIKRILADFFRHAFDGSGADNFMDAGSCIDGRLTSAWNWCSSIEKKSYYPLFLLTGFVGFDGRF